MADHFSLTLKERVKLTSNTEHLIFHKDSELDFVAGQFISLHFDRDGTDVRRNYSVANSPQLKNQVAIAISYVANGLASTVLQNLNVDESIAASGPYGIFTLPSEHPKRYILMGTGTGIAPYRSMLPDIADIISTTNTQFVLLQGVRDSSQLLYWQDFLEFANRYTNFEFRACYSREMPASPKSYEYSGYIQNQLDSLDVTSDDMIYLCGNPGMVDAAYKQLSELGLSRSSIKREKYIHQK